MLRFGLLATSALTMICLPLELAAQQLLPVQKAIPGSPNSNQSEPVLLIADEMINDDNLGVVTARGNVEISQGQRILMADVVSYNRQANVVTATGNVSILEADGTVTFANHVELTDDMRDGFVEGVRVQLSDNSRLAANGADRSGGIQTRLDKAVYSPCDVCKEDPSRAPLWQIKAYKVVHDERTKDIEYKDAFFEVYGVPVAYSPYFAHPDPSVKRRSGFLTPSPGRSSRLGFVYKQPYYYVIDDQSDITVTPFYTQEDGMIGLSEYREEFSNGSLSVKTSASYMDPRDFEGKKTGRAQFRGHIDAHGLWEIDEQYRWGFDIQSTSDDTFLRRFKILRGDLLTTRIYSEGFDYRNYFSANSYAFQGLTNQDVPGASPYILPQINYDHYSETDNWGGRWHVFSDFLALGRTEQDDAVRATLDTSYRLPAYGPFGDVYALTFGVRNNYYFVQGLAQEDRGADFSGQTGRVMPYVGLDWSMPFVSDTEQIRQVITPLVSVAASHTGNNESLIPNNDSRTFDFDHTNLFKINRFPGQDRVDDGVRTTYGVKYSVFGLGQGYSEFFAGQSFRAQDDRIYPRGSGADTQQSDYITNATISPSPWLMMSQRMRLDNSDAAIKRNEVQVAVGPPNLRISGVYAFLENDGSGAIDGNREQASLAGEWVIDNNWSFAASTARDLDRSSQLHYEGKLTYGNECIQLDFLLQRTYARDRDIEPSTDFGVVVRLRNLG